MNKFFQLLAVIIFAVILNMALVMLLTFFDIKREYYNEYMNWVNVLMIFTIVLPDERGNLIKRLIEQDK